MIQIILYTSIYPESNEERAKELAFCLEQNCLSGFDKIVVLVEAATLGQNLSELLNHCENTAAKWGTELVPVMSPTRPTLNDYLDKAYSEDPNSLHILANSDIIIPTKALHQLSDLPWEKKLYVGLSRWDIGREGTLQLLNRPDSADVFAWYGPAEIKGCKCSPGFPGFDNRIAYEFHASGYKVVNPSLDIITKHLHLVQKNNYRQDGKPDGAVLANQICPEPYFFHPPIHIKQI
jgi:hypothetical protein